MSKNSSRSYHGGRVGLNRFFRIGSNTQNGESSNYAKASSDKLLIAGFIRFFSIGRRSSGPDWARTSDPALIKRML